MVPSLDKATQWLWVLPTLLTAIISSDDLPRLDYLMLEG